MARRRRSRPESKPKAKRASSPRRSKGSFLTLAILVALLAIILAVVLTSPLVRPPSGANRVEIGFTSTDGRHHTTSATPFAGRLVLVDLMAVNCPPCRAEMPELLSFREVVRGMDVEIISLSIWADQPGFGENLTDLKAFKESFGADWTFGVPDDTLSLVIEYQVQFPPFKILLDRSGTVVWTKAGETTSDVLLGAIHEVP